MTLAICVHTFGVTLPLSRMLQKPSLSLEEGFNMVQASKNELQGLREDGFQPVFEAATKLSRALDVAVTAPRACKR